MPAARGVKRAAASKAEAKAAAAGPSKIKKKNAPPSAVAQEIAIPKQLCEVLTCGQGDVGQLGLGEDYLEKTRFTIVPLLGNAMVDMCAGGMHTVCVDKNGDVWTFGCNDEGALGRDTSDASTNEWVPGKVKLPGKTVRVSAGDSHTAALLASGQVFAWGSFRDSHGNMGLTPKGNERNPVEMLPGHKCMQIASGGDHLVMLTDSGQIFTCGCAEQGQLGRVTARSCDRNSRLGLNPLLIPTPLNFRPKNKIDFDMLWAGTHCTFAREATKGDIYAWGLNNYDQIGVRKGKPGTVFTPVISEAFAALKNKNWSRITGGPHHTLALDSEGTCYVIGRREYGRLGLGENCEDATDLTPVPILQGKKCVQISCASSSSFAVTDNGDVYVWGMGSSGQLGTGSEDDENEPKLVRSKQLDGRFITNVGAGGQHTVLLVKSLEDAKEVLPVMKAASTAPKSKSDTKAATSKDESETMDADSTNDNELPSQSNQDDVEMASKTEPEKMDVQEAPEEETKKDDKPQKKPALKRGRKGSASSTESSRSAKTAKNKQNGALATVKESENAEETESKPEASAENKTGGNQDEAESSQKSKRAESEEPEPKRLKMDSAESAESDEKKDEAKPEETSAEKEADNKPMETEASAPENKKEESLSNGNGDADPGAPAEPAPEDVEMKSVNEKKCISSESQEEKTDDAAVARTEVKT